MRREFLWLGIALLAGCGDDTVRTVYAPGQCEPVAGSGGGQEATGGSDPSVSSSSGAGSAGAAGGGDGGGGAGGAGGSGAAGGGDGGSGGAGEGGGGGAPDGEPTVLVSGLQSPFFLRCNGSTLAWVNSSAGDVHRANLDGTGVSVVATAVAKSASDIEIDDASLVVAMGGASGRIVRVPLDGSAPSDVMAAPGVQGLALHVGDVYWFDLGNIYRGTDAVAQGAPRDVAVDASGIYYVTGKSIWVAPIDGGAARKLAETPEPLEGTLRLEADRVAWGTLSGLLRVTKGVGFPETIADTTVARLAVMPGIYAWSNNEAVYAMREGEEPRTLAPALGGGGVVLCGGFMFWLSRDAGVIMRAVP